MKTTPLILLLGLSLALTGSPQTLAAESDRHEAERARARAELDRARADMEAARAEVRKAAERMAAASTAMGDEARAMAFRYVGDPDRGMLGVVLGQSPKGVRINALTPGGAAEQAGVRVGDVVVAVNGRAMRQQGDAVDEVRAAVAELKVGQTVALRLRRDGKEREVEVVASRREAPVWFSGNTDFAFDFDAESLRKLGPDIDRQVRDSLRAAGVDAGMGERIRRQVHASMGDGFSGYWFGSSDDLELAQLNPGLGRYFGTDRGVLVLERAGNDYAGLEPGDVLLKIDGRTVDSPRTALNALGTQDKGERFQVEILRDRQTLTLELEGTGNLLELRGLLPPPPAPPAPPAPPTPPGAAVAPPPPAPPAPPSPQGTAAPPPAPPAPPSPPARGADLRL